MFIMFVFCDVFDVCNDQDVFNVRYSWSDNIISHEHVCGVHDDTVGSISIAMAYRK